MKKFNFALQLFADNVINATTSKTTDNDLSAENKTFYEKQLIEEAESELIFDQLADKYPIPKNGGKSIEFRKFSPLSANKDETKLVEGVTPAGNKLNVTSITAQVDQFGDYVTVTDMLKGTAIDPVITQATSIIGSQAGRVLNNVTKEVISGGTFRKLAPRSDGTAVELRSELDKTCRPTIKLLRAIANDLKRNNAPKINGSYIGIVHPDIGTEIMNLDNWTDVNKYKNPEKIYNGEIGSIAGIRFIENTECKIWKSADDNCPNNYVETEDTSKQTGKTYYTKNADGTYTEFSGSSFSSETTYYEADGVLAVYASYFIAKGAYATTEIEGGGLEHIVKPIGAGDDALNQRGTVGWKATKCAEILVQQYLHRMECCSELSDTDAVVAN